MKLDITTLEAKTAGQVELADAIFGLEPRSDLIHRMVRYQLLKRMAGTHHVQDRSEITTTGKKMYKQKGTGGARHGDKSVPQWRGGGVVFGPTPRDHSFRVNKKEKVLALRSALTDRHAGGNLVVLDGLDFDTPKTAKAVELLEGLGLGGRKLLFVVDGLEEAAIKSFRNLPAVHLITFDQLNTYDVLNSDTVVFTRDSLDAFLGRSAGEEQADEELVLEEGDGK